DGQFVDLTRQSGVRLWARCGTAAARLLFELHHSCCDGLGGFRFVGDVLAAYARQTSGDSAAKLPPLDAELLEGRGTFGITRPTPREWIGHAAYTLTDGLRLMARRPLAVAVPQTNSDTTVHSPPVHRIETRILDPAELDALQRAARASGVTVNDLLLCYLFAALLDWNRVHGRREPRGWLRVNVPTNLRRREDERMPAANVMSFAFLDRHTRDCQDLAGLLQSIRRETKAIKDRRLGLYFIVQMGILAAIPGALPFALSRGRCLATAVLTNVGDLTGPWSEQLPRQGDKLAVGNLVLESVGGTPPLRRLTHVGVGVATYGGRMSVSLLCDRHCFNQEQAGQFLDSYVARILAGVE
ncbi:MAG TPA: hypothetical protein VGX76_21030, partial [Pirellulales bacterium]|nr:hypothetical protein [Pirellulales bacterium]